MEEEEIKDWKERIDNMSRFEMARLFRYAPAGHAIWDKRNGDILSDYFQKRFTSLGGFSPQISKALDRR